MVEPTRLFLLLSLIAPLLKKTSIWCGMLWAAGFGLSAQPGNKSHELKKITIEEYIRTYAPVAKEEMRRYGIPASITLAQGILESNFGNSPLAREANNHFGIKCHTGWQGKGYYMTDDAVNECFRIYDSPEESFRDHSEFLRTRPRYADLFKLDPKDYKGWARGLQAAGYATNPQYANLLIRIIEERRLHQYDTADPELAAKLETKEDVIRVFENKIMIFNGLKVVVAQPRQTITEIGRHFNLEYEKLKKYNDILNDDDTNYYLIPGSKVYLQQKKTKGFNITHRVQENETMHSIAQKEGIRLAHLYKLNLMSVGEEPAIGEVLQLRKKAKKPPRLKNPIEVERLYKKIKRLTAKEKPDDANTSIKGLEPEQDGEVVKPANPAPLDTIGTDQPTQKNKPSADSTPKKKELTTPPLSPPAPIYHIVEPKQTLYSISLMYNVRIEDLQQWNHLKGNIISAGQSLIVGYTSDNIQTADDLRVKKPAWTPIYHTVKPRETLISIADWYNVKTEDIKRWNNLNTYHVSPGTSLIVGYVKDDPQKKITTTSVDEASSDVPENSRPPMKPERATQKETEAPAKISDPSSSTPEPKKLPKYHFAEAGETLFSLSRKYQVSIDDIMQWNNLQSPAIYRGQRLIVGYYIEREETTKPPLPTANPTLPLKEPRKETSTSSSATSPSYHVVQPGETLFSISRKYNITVEQLTEWNNISGTALTVGQRLVVTSPPPPTLPNSPLTEIKYHTVEPGETAYSISRKYGITVDQIKQWNQLPDYHLKAGQRIIVGK